MSVRPMKTTYPMPRMVMSFFSCQGCERHILYVGMLPVLSNGEPDLSNPLGFCVPAIEVALGVFFVLFC
jgi:hypothetical protein